jgi:hypothetical protein
MELALGVEASDRSAFKSQIRSPFQNQILQAQKKQQNDRPEADRLGCSRCRRQKMFLVGERNFLWDRKTDSPAGRALVKTTEDGQKN